jgi:hypothetical protein
VYRNFYSERVKEAWKKWDGAERRVNNAPPDMPADQYLALLKEAVGCKRTFLYYNGQSLHVRP